jgi:hypothetical protein
MADNKLTQEQVEKMLNRMNVNVGGFKNSRGTKVVYGSASYTQPIINKKLDLTIKASGHYATGNFGTDKGVGYKGISLNYNF